MGGRWSMLRCVALGTLLLLVTGMLITAPPAVASAKPRGVANNTVTVSVSPWDSTPFTYASGNAPTFKVIVTFATKPPAVSPFDVSTQVNGTGSSYQSCCNPTASPDGLTYTYKVPMSWSVVPVGNDSVIATYRPTSVYSPPYAFTVNKGTPSMQCFINNYSGILTPGYTLYFQMTPESGSPDAPVDWQNATYTVKFVGATTVTRSNLAPNSNDVVTVQAPDQTGRYSEVDCIFNGTNLFTSATTNAAGQPVLVSQEKSLGGVQLYTNPTTLASNRPADMYVVFHAGSGGPTPTGYFNIDFGNNYSNGLTIGSNGTLLVHIDQLPNLNGVSQVTISYHGDPYYNQAVVNFPLTNPPIPGNGGGGSGGGGGGSSGGGARPTSTPAATATSSPTGIASGSTVPTPTTTAPVKPLLASASATNSGVLWWIVLLVLIILGGSGGGAVIAVRRGKASARATGRAPDGSPAPGESAATTEAMAPPPNQETER